MKKSHVAGFGLVLVSTFMLVSGAFAQETYPDQFGVRSNVYHQIFENDRVRASEIKFEPGEKIAMHTHAYDHLVYIFEAGQLTLSYPDGKTSVIDGVVGNAMWIGKETHAAQNTGPTTLRALIVELKS